jgi:hypothetical protein
MCPDASGGKTGKRGSGNVKYVLNLKKRFENFANGFIIKLGMFIFGITEEIRDKQTRVRK